MTEQTEVRELSMNECWALLRSAPVGRLAAQVGAHVEIFPITFIVVGGTIVFRTGEGTKVAAMTVNPEVAFEADGYDENTHEAWSVVARARAGDIADADVPDALDGSLVPWHAGPKHRLVQLAPSRLSGRRFAVQPQALAPISAPTSHAAVE